MAQLLKYCPESGEFWLDGQYLLLGLKEIKLLLRLVKAAQTPTQSLVGIVDHKDGSGHRDYAAVHVLVSRLRQKLEGHIAFNYKHSGYRLTVPVERVPYERPVGLQ